MVEEVYVVENCDYGIEKAFWTMEAARQYVLKDYLDFVKDNEYSFNAGELVSDIEQLFDEGCIENRYYIYSLEVEG